MQVRLRVKCVDYIAVPTRICYGTMDLVRPTADSRDTLVQHIPWRYMDQQHIISIMQRSGVPYDPKPTIQKSLSLVRFFHRATDRSLNLGYRSTQGVFVADFVFKFRETLDQNQADLASFLRLFGGEVGKRPTPFARLQPPLSQEEWLIDVIRAYWAMGNPLLITNRDE